MVVRKLLVVTGLLFLTATGSLGSVDKVGEYNIGAGAGFVTGYGISYRQWVGTYGYQITTTPYYNKNDYSSHFSLSVGATGLRMIKEARVVNLFGYFGPHLFYSRDEYSDDGYLSNSTYVSAKNVVNSTKVLFVGGGSGLDCHFSTVSLNLMFGVMGRTTFGESGAGVSLTGEVSVYYSF